MSHESTPAAGPLDASMPQRSPELGNPRSAWLVLGLTAGLLWVAALQGSLGVIVWLLATGSLLVLTALYALGFRRRSWANLDTLEQRKFALSLGAVVLVVGMVAGVVSTPDPVRSSVSADAEGLRPRPDLFALPPTTPPPGAVLNLPLPSGVEDAIDDSTDEPGDVAVLADALVQEPLQQVSLRNSPCVSEGDTRTERQVAYRCTRNPAGDLVWLDRASVSQQVQAEQEEKARQAEAERARQADANRREQEAQQRAAEELARAEEAARNPQPLPQPPVNPPADSPQPPPVEPPVGPPTDPGEPPPQPPTEPPTPPTEPPTSPPSPDPTAPPPAPPTPPGPPEPGTPDPDIPVIPPEFPFPPDPPSPPRPTPPPSSFAPPSDAPDSTEAAIEAVLPAAR
ncbi:hypothetical protein [Arthrobacter sp. zg-Y1116]|uniref:hypothetical protein n=1 Tax=Arthrobacter sp. zg-Y1116 TaxID=2964611 RepID=UPI00210841A2|nr:hypothetical protein [Arthrobacter sp. zg-Y1116]MCQ1947610.1 hypothetical protein [Arthrobacter sp. zg-Y1116]